MFTSRRTLVAATLAVVGCRSQAPAAPSSPTSQTQESQALKPGPGARAPAIAIRVPAKGGTPTVYRLPGLQEMPSVLRGRLPPVASVVGLDPESEMLFAATPKGEVLGFDLESGRVTRRSGSCRWSGACGSRGRSRSLPLRGSCSGPPTDGSSRSSPRTSRA